jgi:hypothetical protein
MSLVIRTARLADAHMLAQAERTITATPGFLISKPAEISDERFERRIAALDDIDNGKYLVAEIAGELVGHAMLVK